MVMAMMRAFCSPQMSLLMSLLGSTAREQSQVRAELRMPTRHDGVSTVDQSMHMGGSQAKMAGMLTRL